MTLGLDMLDVTIGVVFVYLLISLIATSVAELIEVMLKKRAANLEKGIGELLHGNKDLVAAIYDHPLISSLYEGSSYAKAKENNALPSYIPARNFALAAMDLFFPPKTEATSVVNEEMTKLRELAKNKKASTFDIGPELAARIVSIFDTAQGDAEKVRPALENWFNSTMDRVSGWYKRWSHKILLVIGALLAISFNVDTIEITQALSLDKSLRDAAVQTAVKFAKENPSAKTPEAKNPEPPPPAPNPPAPTVTSTTTSGTTTTTTTTATGTTVTGTAATGTTATTDTTATTATTDTTGTNPTTKNPDEKLEGQIREYTKSFKALGLPVGWKIERAKWEQQQKDQKQQNKPPLTWCELAWMSFREHILGWIITTFAISLGAPFWFDTLNKIIVVRSTVKPQEKSGTEASKDPTGK